MSVPKEQAGSQNLVLCVEDHTLRVPEVGLEELRTRFGEQ